MKLSDCTAEGNRGLLSLQARKKINIASLFPLLHKPCSCVLRYGSEMVMLGSGQRSGYAQAGEAIRPNQCRSLYVWPGLWL